jgi:hypothetical protein
VYLFLDHFVITGFKQKGGIHLQNKNAFLSLALLVLLLINVDGQEYENHAEKALADSTFAWKTITSNKIRIYYQKGSFAERHRVMILRSVTTAVDEVLNFLGESDWNRVLNVFYLESRQEMKKIVGHPYTGFSDWTANAIFIVLNPEWRSFEKHEFTHVVTMGIWGLPHETSRWMIEGVAVCCDGWCREYSVDEIAFHLLSNDQLPKLEELFKNFASLGEIRAGISAGSFIGFIVKTFGVDKLRSLWSEGVGNIREVLGGDLNQIETSWRSYLRQKVQKDIPLDLDNINELKCG